jgi:H+/Cl- antiporter ClcA
MTKWKFQKLLFSFEQIPSLIYLLKWILICLMIGVLVGSVSAFFLFSLDWATNWRESHLWIIAFLPVGGFIIGLSYHLYGNSVVKGNNLLLEEFHSPKKIIPFKIGTTRSLWDYSDPFFWRFCRARRNSSTNRWSNC